MFVSDSFGGTVLWWLRSPGYSNEKASYIAHGGRVIEGGTDVNKLDGEIGVRPAIWVTIG